MAGTRGGGFLPAQAASAAARMTPAIRREVGRALSIGHLRGIRDEDQVTPIPSAAQDARQERSTAETQRRREGRSAFPLSSLRLCVSAVIHYFPAPRKSERDHEAWRLAAAAGAA